MSSVSIARTAGTLAGLYWELAEEMRLAAVTLSTAVGPDSALPVVNGERMIEAMKAALILRHLAERGQG